jgi:hypothetical protein
MEYADIPNSGACIAIFAARELPNTLFSTIAKALAAAPNNTIIDVLVNGNPSLARLTAEHVKSIELQGNAPCIRVWSLVVGDKAHAWNQHIHQIWNGCGPVFYIDGYVRLQPDAVHLLSKCMFQHPNTLAGTGVPSTGNDAPRLRAIMMRDGGFHGNFCCITKEALTEFKSRQIRLPLGLYRTDSTIGSILSFGLDPAKNSWDIRRHIAIEPRATWQTDPKLWWRLGDLKASLKRTLRQAQGQLENQAIRNHLAIRKLAPEDLPLSVSKLVLDWESCNPNEAALVLKGNPLARYALAKLRTPIDWSDTLIAPALICQSGCHESQMDLIS